MINTYRQSCLLLFLFRCCLPTSDSRTVRVNEYLPPALAGGSAFLFKLLVLSFFAAAPTEAPGLSSQSGQNHSPSGILSSGGVRQARWYGASHCITHRLVKPTTATTTPTFSHSSTSGPSSPLSSPHWIHASGGSTSRGCLGRSEYFPSGFAMNSVVFWPAAMLSWNKVNTAKRGEGVDELKNIHANKGHVPSRFGSTFRFIWAETKFAFTHIVCQKLECSRK